MLPVILNKSWRQQPTKQQLYGQLPLITKTIQLRRNRHAGHCWRSRDPLISDLLLSTTTYGRGKAGRTARSYIQKLGEDTGWRAVHLPEEINDREKWPERLTDIYPCWRHNMMMMMMMIIIIIIIIIIKCALLAEMR